MMQQKFPFAGETRSVKFHVGKPSFGNSITHVHHVTWLAHLIYESAMRSTARITVKFIIRRYCITWPQDHSTTQLLDLFIMGPFDHSNYWMIDCLGRSAIIWKVWKSTVPIDHRITYPRSYHRPPHMQAWCEAWILMRLDNTGWWLAR